MKRNVFLTGAWMISGLACTALCFRPLSWMFCALMACILIVGNKAVSRSFSSVRHTKLSRILAGVLCLFLGWGFREAWMNHHLVQMVMGKLPFAFADGKTLITLCSVAGVIVGYPFASAAVSFFCFAGESAAENKALHARLNEENLFRLVVGAAAAATVIQIAACFSDALWFDEAFSMAVIKLPWKEMLSVIVQDVHPPLYYYILKAGTALLRLFLPNASLVVLAKLMAAIPHVCMLLMGATVVRKRWNKMTAAVFMALLIGSPGFVSFGYEIRMYSWAMLFVIAAYLAADRILREGGAAAWIVFVGASLLAAYTHYYACVTVALFYLVILYRFMRGQRKRIVHWLCAAAATVAGYGPWLFVFLSQAKSVSQAYWIEGISFDVLAHIGFILDTSYVWLAVFAAACALCARRKDDESGEDAQIAVSGMVSPLWVIAVGMTVSVLIRPLFISRYAVLALPCCLLGTAIAVGTKAHPAAARRMAALLACVCLCNSISLFAQERKMEGRTERLQEFAQAETACAFLTDESYLGLTIGEMTGKTCYHLNTRIKARDSWMFDVFAQAQVMGNADEVGALLDEGTSLFFIESAGSSRAEEMAAFTGYGLQYVGEYPVEEAAVLYRFVR